MRESVNNIQMIEIENIEANIIQVTPPEKLQAGDFAKMKTRIDDLIEQHGKIRLLVNASKFNGWKNKEALKEHVEFVKDRHRNVERIAMVAGHEWQRWLAEIMNMILGPEIRVFNKKGLAEAEKWLLS